jgi:hypothetical protein
LNTEPSTKGVQNTVPREGVKLKDKGKGPTKNPCKKRKSNKIPPVYNMIDDEMDRINVQVRYSIEEAMEEAT